jgi:ribosome-binding protein aMBF1 (putative translation factor)
MKPAMKTEKREALEAAGYRFGDAEDFLDLTDEERKIVALRVAVAKQIRRAREKAGLSQKALGEKLRTSQPRVARIESGAGDVSLDQMFRSLFAAGGNLADVGKAITEVRSALKNERAKSSGKV